MKCLIVGASAGLGRCLGEALAAGGHDLFLLASDERDLAPLAASLSLRFGVSAGFTAMDLRKVDADALRQATVAFFHEPPGAVLFVAGAGRADDTGHLEPAALDDLIDLNFRSGVAIVNAFLPDMLDGKTRLCVGIGSVAAVRGRGANMVYGAAKRGLEFYFEALRHRLQAAGCRVQFYRVGFMRTAMFGDRKTLIPAVEPETVARQIAGNLERDVGCVYAPPWWMAIALILRLIPWCIFRRLSI